MPSATDLQPQADHPTRHTLVRPDCTLSYLDFGGTGPILIALHGHFGCARNFARLAQDLSPAHRVIALDQRGHGWSTHPEDCSRAAYISDILALADQLSPAQPVDLLGHSLGGVNAYQFAARHPQRIRRLIVEDIGTAVRRTAPLGLDWPRRFASLWLLQASLAPSGIGHDQHFIDSLNEFEDGWGFRFDPAWIARSQAAVQGDWSQDWQAVSAATLLIRGRHSWATTRHNLEQMAHQHPDCELIELEAGHTVHNDQPTAFAEAVAAFLAAQQGKTHAARLTQTT